MGSAPVAWAILYADWARGVAANCSNTRARVSLPKSGSMMDGVPVDYYTLCIIYEGCASVAELGGTATTPQSGTLLPRWP